MSALSSALNAAIRALQGETELDAILPALSSWKFAQGIALSPNAHRTVRAIAALFGRLPTLLDAPTIDAPAFHDAVARLIGTKKGWRAMQSLAAIVPAGWGAVHADALIAAARKNQCDPASAAALIGACNESASLLHSPEDIAFAIRRWGQATPETPTAWMHAISGEERDRLIAMVQSDADDIVRCLPWLPPAIAHQSPLRKSFLFFALEAFADASPTAQTLHADLLKRLIARAYPTFLGTLTRLACAMTSEEVWARGATLVQESPNEASRVVAAAPWESLPETIRTAILEHVSDSDICAAIASAQGDGVVKRIADESAIAFFAALNPTVWDALPSAEQRRWRDALPDDAAHLAVRALGPRPEFLAHAILDNDLMRAVQRHTCDDATLHRALFPVALRNIPPDVTHALIAALPTPPPDPGVFFIVAGKHNNGDRVTDASAVLYSRNDIALAIALQRCADHHESLYSQCMALHDALREQSGKDLGSIISLLSDDARNALMPDTDALVEHLAHPDRRDALRQTLAHLTSLPPEVAIPTQYALHRWGLNPIDADEAATVIAFALRGHGNVFLAMLDAMKDDRRAVLLPLPKRTILADALRGFARDDPPTAQRLARALYKPHQQHALCALLAAAAPHAEAIWNALSAKKQRDLCMRIPYAPLSGDEITPRISIAALALAAIRSDDHDLQNAGFAALSIRSDALRAIWGRLQKETQQILRSHQSTAAAVADIPDESQTLFSTRCMTR